MGNEEAIQILAGIRVQYLLNKKQEEADAIFLGMKSLAANTNRPYIQCKNCGKWYRRQIEEQASDKNDIVVYYCYCPYCGEEYEWDECYWRQIYYMIISAACRCTMNNGEKVIIPCHRHCDFFEIMYMLHCQYDKNSVEQGFIAWDGVEERFVSRQEAAKIAYTWRQIDQPIKTLYSEDLW